MKPSAPIRPLNITINIGFVAYGYQVDYYLNGEKITSECRDFSDDYKISELEDRFMEAIVEAIAKTRKTL